jgi:hypothetical protein
MRFRWDGHELFGHDGNTLGQSAFLRVLPEQGLVVALLTNGGHTQDLYAELCGEVFGEVAGVAMPAPFTPPDPAPTVDVAGRVGRYHHILGQVGAEPDRLAGHGIDQQAHRWAGLRGHQRTSGNHVAGRGM